MHDNAKIRIFLCTGPWHLITLLASLRTHEAETHSTSKCDDYLVLLGGLWQKPLRDALIGSATQMHAWKNVVNIDDALNISDVKQLPQLASRLHEQGLPPTADELWIPLFWPHTPRVAAEIWKTANIYLFEEGLSTYSNFSIASYWDFLCRKVKNFLRHESLQKKTFAHFRSLLSCMLDRRNLIWAGGALPQHIRRTKKSFILLDGLLPLPNDFPKSISVVPINKTFLLSVLKTYQENEGITAGSPQNDRPKVLFLGQMFSQRKNISRQEEVQIYANTVNKLVAAGYQVIWKDHPRAIPPFFDDMKKCSPENVSTLHNIQGCPIEVLLPSLNLAFCVSVYSSTLFYARAVYGLESYATASECIHYFRNDKELFDGLSLTIKHIPDLSQRLAKK